MASIFAQPPLRRKRSEAGSLASTTTPSPSHTREEKSAAYTSDKYDALLDSKDVIMGWPTGQITPESRRWCETLMKTETSVRDGSIFQDNSFNRLYDKLKGANEARIVQDIARLIVPSAETFHTLGNDDLAYLVESVNEGWDNAVPLVGPRPQPDYSVGFNRKAFSKDQNKQLVPYVGTWPSSRLSYFMGTWYMHFPFLASEVKSGSGGLEVADRQNAHSMTLAVRAVVNLYRTVNRVKEIDREILAFSVSHDSKYVRIYGHFPVIDGDKVDYCRHSIDSYDLTASEGEKRWTAYKFVANVYNLWAPRHLQRLQSAIDDLSHEKKCGSVRGIRETVQSQGSSNQVGSSSQAGSSTQAGSSIAPVEPIGDIDGDVEVSPLTPGTSFSEQAPLKRRKN